MCACVLLVGGFVSGWVLLQSHFMAATVCCHEGQLHAVVCRGVQRVTTAHVLWHGMQIRLHMSTLFD